jgi:hypothetical protein
MSDPRSSAPSTADDTGEDSTPEELAERVEEKYDFENFGPRDMAEMTPEEWEAVFDPDSWITGPELLNRVEADLRNRIAERDVFAVLERETVGGDVADSEGADGERSDPETGDSEEVLVAYSDEGWAYVYEDGTVEGSGTVLRDVKPSVALASMDDYEVSDPPEGTALPTPEEIAEGSGDLGNVMMQVVGGIQILAGLGLLVAWIALSLPVVAGIAAFGFLLFGVFVFLLVANARLSDRFRAAEYRDRLRAAGVESGDRPEFLPQPGRRSDETDDGT